MKFKNYSVNKKIFLVLFILLFTILLGIFLYKGIFIRYAADDYCYGAEVQSRGFWKAQINSYLNQMPYNSNRFSSTFVQGLAEILGGPYFAPFVPGMMIISWVFGIYFLITQIKRYFEIDIAPINLFLSTLILVFFTLFLAPNPYQNLYWLSGSIAYLLPIIMNIYLFGLLFFFLQAKKTKIIHLVFILIFAFFAAGFSETTALWHFSILFFITLLFWIRKKGHRPMKSIFISAFIGTILAIILLAVSPPNFLDMAAGQFNQPDLITLITRSIGNARMFISGSIKFNLLPFFAIGFLGLWLGWITKESENKSSKKLLQEFVLLLIVGISLIIATMVPSMLAKSAYPGERALIPAMFTLVSIIFLSSWKIARFLSGNRSFIKIYPLISLTISIGVIFAFAYTLSTTPNLTKPITAFAERAEAWDFRNELLLAAKDSETTKVIIPAFDGVVEIADFSENEGFWINNCGEKYYQVTSIEAIENYLGITSHPIIP